MTTYSMDTGMLIEVPRRRLCRLALGTAQFGMNYGIANEAGQMAATAARDVIGAASDYGVDLLDTAIAYGDSESCLGSIGVEPFRVVTKLPALPRSMDDVATWVESQVAESRTRLRKGRLYGLLLHRPADLVGPLGQRLYYALMKLKERGVAEKVGVSIYNPAELTELAAFKLDIVQAPFNVLDRRLHSSGWLARLKDDDVEIHSRSPLLQGLLTLPEHRILEKFREWTPIWRVWFEWLQTENVDPISACMRFVLSYEEIDRVVVGVDKVEHLRQIAAGACGDAILAPNALRCDDERLINPSLWGTS